MQYLVVYPDLTHKVVDNKSSMSELLGDTAKRIVLLTGHAAYVGEENKGELNHYANNIGWSNNYHIRGPFVVAGFLGEDGKGVGLDVSTLAIYLEMLKVTKHDQELQSK